MGKAIVASLRLDSSDYDKKLAAAKKKTADFSKGGGADLSAMAGKFKTLAVAVAGSKAAMEVFNAAIKSSQTLGDAYTVAMEQAKGSLGEFVYAMANADFSGFNDGLKGILSNAKEAAQALDSLGNAQISYDYLTAGMKSEYKTNIGIAKDKSLSLSEREAALAAANVNLDEIGEAVAVYTDKAIAAVVASAKAKGNNINQSFITRENIDRVFALDLSANGDAEKAALAERYKEFKKLKKEEKKLEMAVSTARTNGYASEAIYVRQLGELRAKINSDDMQMAALYNAMLVKGTDEWLKGLADLVIKSDNANAAYQELKTSSLEVAQNIKNAATEAGKLAQNANATIDPDRYKKDKVSLTMAGIGKGSSLDAKLPATLEAVEPVVLYEKELKILQDTAVSASEGLGALGGAIGGLSGVLGDGAGAWASYAGGIVSSIGSALPALEAFAAAKMAAAAAGAAMNPWTAVSAVAAIASIGAAMASLPKFATGGIVPGNALSGDNVLIRANSGETVLTKEQANNIGSLLRGGFGGNVRFVIEGDKLVGVLNNHNRIAGRNYGT